MSVCQPDAGGGVVRPASQESGIRDCCGAVVRDPVHGDDRPQVARFGGGDGNPAGRQGDHGPVVALLPGVLEHGERDGQPRLLSGAQIQLAPGIVVADHDRVVPDGKGPEAVVLQHDHRIARRHLAQQIVQARGELVRRYPVAARRGQHLDLQASLPFRDIDLSDEILRGDLHARFDERGRQRRGAALIIFLREERHRAELDPLRHARRPGVAQRVRLRNQRCAAAQRGPKQKNARCPAGASAQGHKFRDRLLH